MNEKENDVSYEYNVVCCMFCTVCGPVLDALCALPGTTLDDVPGSLRTSCLVLTVLLGSPSMRPDMSYVLEQRVVLAILLGICGFLGLNQADIAARNSDAVFSLIGTLACIVASRTNGAMKQKDDDKNDKSSISRENLSSFCGAIFFYLGTRTLRHSFALPYEIINFKISKDDITTRGYGVVDDMVVLGNAFTGSVSIGFGVIVLLNHDLVLSVGSSGLSCIASILACFAFLGSFLAQMASFCAMERLPALFSSVACDGDATECAAAYRARRLFISSNSTSVGWVCAISMAVYSFSSHRQLKTRRSHYNRLFNIYDFEYMSVFFVCLLACSIVLVFSPGQSSSNGADIELVLLLSSIPLCVSGHTFVACIAHSIGQGMYVYTRFYSHDGYDFTFFTHHCLLATLILTILVAFLSLFSHVLYIVSPQRLFSDPVEKMNGALLTSLLSIQVFLTLATMGMSSGYSGIKYEDDKGSWRVSGMEFTVQHCVSLFFVGALWATRFEQNALTPAWRRLVWFLVPLVLGILWIICISTVTDEGSPYQQYVDEVSFVVGVSSAAISWTGVGIFLHT